MLREARALIAQGWTRGTRRRQYKRAPTGYSYCVLGAVDAVPSTLAAQEAATRALNEVLARDYQVEKYDRFGGAYKHTPGIPTFNDRMAKSKKDVLVLFDKAIALTTGGK